MFLQESVEKMFLFQSLRGHSESYTFSFSYLLQGAVPLCHLLASHPVEKYPETSEVPDIFPGYTVNCFDLNAFQYESVRNKDWIMFLLHLKWLQDVLPLVPFLQAEGNFHNPF